LTETLRYEMSHTAEELREAFADRSGYKPKTPREAAQFERITEQWADAGISPREVRQAIRGFWTTYPQDPATPLRVNQEFSGFVALVTPRPPVSREDYGPRPGDVGPPVELVSRFLGSKESA
jgi:hypothetical protein